MQFSQSIIAKDMNAEQKEFYCTGWAMRTYMLPEAV
jgi:hypothetical protein